ncbi:toll/interleukin-1 receptor domain-containing protein [Verrucomicrobiales bacterium BCK34]|nr:toll/interleukin-1 receptor domain-containing protein [Verrucomicrobiales bacterium BCK34]
MKEKREYWTFVSYRHLDNHEHGREWATWIAREIETYEVPPELVGTKGERGDEIPERIYPVFRDEDELSADDDLSSPIYEALRNSKTVVVICSPQSVTSRYVGNEISYFKSLGRSERVLAMMIEGEPHDTGGRECFPTELKHPVNESGEIDLTIDVEPVAADFRLLDGSQGWTSKHECFKRLPDKTTAKKYLERCELAKLKIIAGILGVPLGVLVERDKTYQLEQAKRKARIFTAVSAAMGVLAVLAVAGGVIAWLKAGEAARERDSAQKSEKVALQARGTAEDLIGKMLFDLGGKLEPIGRLDILEDVSLAAESYFTDLPSDQVDADSERNRSVMLDSRARILKASGNLDAALERYRESLDLVKRLTTENPGNLVLESDVVLGLKNVADILINQDRTAEAITLYEEAAARLTALTDEHLGEEDANGLLLSLLGESGDEAKVKAREFFRTRPEIAGLMETSAVLMERLGKAAITKGDFAGAKDYLGNAVEIQKALSTAAPDSRQILESLASGYNALGNLAVNMRNSAEAGEHFQNLIDLAKRELVREPDNVLWKEKLAGGLERLSYVASEQGDNARFSQLASEALSIWQAIAEADPGNTIRQRNLYVGLTKSAFAEKANGNPEASLKQFMKAGEISAALVELDPTNMLWRQDRAFNLASQANSHQNAGNQKLALEKTLEGITHQRIVTASAPENLTYRRNLLIALNGAATNYWVLENLEEATRYFKESSVIGESILADLPQPTSVSHRDLANNYDYIGQIAEQKKDFKTAALWYEKSIAIARKAYEMDLAWEGITEELFEKARANIERLKAAPNTP